MMKILMLIAMCFTVTMFLYGNVTMSGFAAGMSFTCTVVLIFFNALDGLGGN